MNCEISIRIIFPDDITSVLRQEKQRFVTDYESSYKSEPHITLYLDSYTEEGFQKLLVGLQELRIQPFTISLLSPKINIDDQHHRSLYVVDISNKQQLVELHEKIAELANPYRSTFLREKTQKALEHQGIHTDGTRDSLKSYNIPEEEFDPHITLGEIDFEKPQADITDSQKNLHSVIGEEITVSSIVVYFYGKGDGMEKMSLLNETYIPFST